MLKYKVAFTNVVRMYSYFYIRNLDKKINFLILLKLPAKYCNSALFPTSTVSQSNNLLQRMLIKLQYIILFHKNLVNE